MRFAFLFALSLAALSHSVVAELKWEKSDQHYDRSPDDKFIEAHYAFRNAGAEPITIKALRSSCGCTTAKLEKKTYAPGEQGEVVVKFTFADRKGAAYRKTVTVNTDEKTGTPTVLNLVVSIYDPVTLNPALVWWKRGDATEAKSVQVQTDAGQNVKITGVTSSSPKFTAKLIPGSAGQAPSVTITPVDTTAKDAAEIKVQTNFPSDAPHAYTIFARIK
jgi:hypothetical protein